MEVALWQRPSRVYIYHHYLHTASTFIRPIPNQDGSAEPLFDRYLTLCYGLLALTDTAGSGSVFALKQSYRFCHIKSPDSVL
jgi:hypothetical protein